VLKDRQLPALLLLFPLKMQTFRLLYRGPGQTWSICRSLLATGLCRSRGRALRQFWLQAVAGIIGVKSSNALRINSRCTWQPREGRETSTTPPSAARSARCAPAGASLQTSTADPEALHRSGTLSRSGTLQWRTREEKRPNRLTIPRDAIPARLSYFRLLAMASPHWMLVASD